MPRHFAIDERLDPADHKAYEALLRQPASTIDELMAWLEQRGYTISRGAVHRHRQSFDEKMDALRRASEMARVYTDFAREGDSASLSDATLVRWQQVLMETIFAMEAGDEVDAKEMANVAKALKDTMTAIKGREAIREQYEARQREALTEAEKAAEAGATGDDVVRKVREILGVASA